MDRDDIIRMAQKVSGVEFPASMEGGKIGMNIEHLERFAHLVAVAEREACALEVEKAGMEGYGTLAAAAAIRARGQNGL